MMRKILHILLIFGFSISAFAQSNQLSFEKKLVKYFQEYNWDDVVVTRDSLYTSPFKKKFNVSVSENYIEFDTAHIVIKNPYFSDKYEDAEEDKDYVKNFPTSFSVIYENSLISLFENGKFACYKLGNYSRDKSLERNLNTKRFIQHWIINGSLYAQSKGIIGGLYKWTGNKWKKSNIKLPIKEQSILYGDDEFVVFRDCFGEWGGTIYFYEIATKKTYFTESTCANSIIKDKNGYNVLAHLGHGGGSAEIKVIEDPRKLSLVKSNEINKTVNGQALGYSDNSKAFEEKLDFYGVQIFSSFKYENKKLYIVNLSELTFIAEIENNQIKIVNPLFFSDLYTHDPITKQYGDYTLINLDHYGTGLKREITVLIIKQGKITKLDWNENHSR